MYYQIMNIEIESTKYEALLDSLKRPEANKREALSEYAKILGKKNLKPYQEKLIEAATSYFKNSKQDNEGPHIKISKEMAEDAYILPSSESGEYSPSIVINAFEEIICSKDAHLDIRIGLLNALLDKKQYTEKTLRLADQVVFSNRQDVEQADFIQKARNQIFNAAKSYIGSNYDAGTHQANLRDLILERFSNNKLDEGEMVEFGRKLIEDYRGDHTQIFEQVITVESAREEVRIAALKKLLETKKYTNKTIDFLESVVFSEDEKEDSSGVEFLDIAREISVKYVDEHLDTKLEPDTPPDRLRRLILDRFAQNKLSEGLMIKLVKSLAGDPPEHARLLLAVSRVVSVHPEVKRRALEAIEKLGNYI